MLSYTSAISKTDNPIKAEIDPLFFLVKHNSYYEWGKSLVLSWAAKLTVKTKMNHSPLFLSKACQDLEVSIS